jgi:hypothetical protein
MSDPETPTAEASDGDVFALIDGYVTRVRRDLDTRIEAWTPDVSRIYVQEVLGGLMARQVTLATQLAQSPNTWNGHLAPVILRAMTDVYITFAWIWGDDDVRAQTYITYGLGQLKLQLEHLTAHVEARGEDPTTHPLIQAHRRALEVERLSAFTEVNIGSWSGIDTRKMAEEAGCLDLYRFAYSPFSRAAHSMWPHVSQYNLKPCVNPLHRMHRVPTDEDWPLDVDYLYRAAKYVDKTMRLFDAKRMHERADESAFKWLVQQLTATDDDPQDFMFGSNLDQPAEPKAHSD